MKGAFSILAEMKSILNFFAFCMAITLLHSCSAPTNSGDNEPQSKAKRESKPNKKNNRQLTGGDWMDYSSHYFDFTFDSPFHYDYEVSVSDSICEYYSPNDDEGYIDLFVWNELDYDDYLKNIKDLGSEILEENGMEYFELIEMEEKENPHILYKIFLEDPKLSRQEDNFESFYKIIWNKREHAILDAAFTCEPHLEKTYEKIARSFRLK